MRAPVRLSVFVALVALSAGSASAANRFPKLSIFGSVSLGCALDYTNPNETRMIVTNTSGQVVAAGSKLSWTTDASRGAFNLARSIEVGAVFSFGLNAKGQNCTVKASAPPLMLAPN